ncbi:hypothetical protein C8Q80DRAFT_530093 [Daedaleopsis nitida]|nr:hypothetical protein C8Q80DRAFT_530093 [Daedaleopsis nitida]
MLTTWTRGPSRSLQPSKMTHGLLMGRLERSVGRIPARLRESLMSWSCTRKTHVETASGRLVRIRHLLVAQQVARHPRSPTLPRANGRWEFTEPSEYHAHVYIPPLADYNKPRAPSRDPQGDIDTFSDDEKIFFIHFLRWRLREGPVPPKLVLWWELGREAPHHDHLSWKKHWEDNPSMPDRIYSEARERRDRETEMESNRSRTVSPPVTLRLYNKHSNHRGVHPCPSHNKSAARPTRRRVTDDDIKAMALYMVEKRRVWNKYTSHSGCWREFANRPQNRARRNLHAWDSIARKQGHRIKEVFDELMGLDENEDDRSLGRNTITVPHRVVQAQVGQPQPTTSTSTAIVETCCAMDADA